MEGPCDHNTYVELLVPDAPGAVHVFIELGVLRELAPESRRLVFVMDLTRRYHLLLDRTVGELSGDLFPGR